MPTPNHQAIWEMDKNHFIHPYTDFSTFNTEGSQIISTADGVYVTDSHNNRYLDGIAGLWCVNIGHGRKEMAETIAQQVLDMQYFNPFGHSTNAPAAQLAQKLSQFAPGDLNHVYYTTGGSTANDSAIRIIHYYYNMRGMPLKKKIISRLNAYHGATCIAANLTGIQATKIKFDQIGEDFIHHISAADMYRRPDDMTEDDYCDHLVREFEERVLQLGADNVAAFIAEPIMGAGGVLVAPKNYHARMKAVCEKYDMLYVADEVVTGFGRLGAMVASQEVLGYTPDLLVLAKGISSGYVPLGAVMISDKIYQEISKPQCEGGLFTMGFTYSGHAVACAAALKNIEIIEREKICQHVQTMGQYFQQKLYDELIEAPIVGDVRGSHMMMGVELVVDKTTKRGFATEIQSANRVFQHALKAGIIIRPIGNIIVLSPPLIIDQALCDELIFKLKQAIIQTACEIL